MESSEWKDQLTISPYFNDEEFISVFDKDNLYNVHRGSVNARDAETDVQLAVNKLQDTARFKASERKSVLSASKHGIGKKVTELGHSLGGTLAEDIASKYGHHSVAFNMGTTPLRSYDSVDRSKHKHFRIKGDFVSSFDRGTGTVVMNSESLAEKKLKKHSLLGRSTPLHFWTSLLNRHFLSSFN